MKYTKLITFIKSFHVSFWFDTEGFWETIKMDEDELKVYHWISICTRKKKLGESVYKMISFVLYPFCINLVFNWTDE